MRMGIEQGGVTVIMLFRLCFPWFALTCSIFLCGLPLDLGLRTMGASYRKGGYALMRLKKKKKGKGKE